MMLWDMDREDFVDLCKKGDEQALNQLYKTYSGKMMKICLRYVPDRQIAQDLLHDGFIVIFTSIGSLRNPERLESWMGVVMKNIALHYLSQNNMVNTIPLSEMSEEDEPAESPFMADLVSYDRLMELVEGLPDGYSKVFKLAVLEGLPHKEIGDLLHIAPHSSSSQLYRAKALLRKMIVDCRLVIIILLLLLVPLFYNYLPWKKKQQSHQPKMAMRQPKAEKRKEDRQTDSLEQKVCPGTGERSQLPELISASPLADAGKVPPILPVGNITISVPPVNKPLFVSDLPSATISGLCPEGNFVSVQRKKKAGVWKFMLAGSLGPQLAQNIYKLIATPHSDSGVGADLPQQVSTWEDYYTYLNTRYQEGTLGDSVTIINIAKNNQGDIVESQHHYSPVTIGLSVNKKLNERWSLETGLQYTFLKSYFTTGNDFRIQETQRIHYIGIPFRVSYCWGNFRNFSLYSTAGMQLDIPLKGTLQTSHITDSIPMSMGRQSLNVPLQWSINASTGVQYHFTPRISLYIEPTVNYYIPDGSGLRTIRKEHPVTFTVPVGLRFSW